jgi:hypothetical protein
MIWIAALYISLNQHEQCKRDVLEGLVLYILLIAEESGFNLLLGDLTELSGVA